jgi:hypothetical protein
MIASHQPFLDAIHARTLLWVRFYSRTDGGSVERRLAPVDYGIRSEDVDGLSRYLFWDGEEAGIHRFLRLLPGEIEGIQVLGQAFDPATVPVSPEPWAIPRDWPVGPSPGL